MPTDIEVTGTAGRYVVCGANALAYRLIEQLISEYDGQVTVVLPTKRSLWAERIGRLPGIAVFQADRLDAETLGRAGLAEADALALVDQDDGGNVDAALVAQELRPDMRIVMRMFNQALGARITELLNNCVVLSAAAIAAPAFVAAALDESSTTPVRVADRTLVAIRRDGNPPDQVIAGLAVLGPRGAEPDLLPADADQRADLVLAVAARARPLRRRRPRGRIRLLPILFSVRLRLVLAAFLTIFVAATVVLALSQRQSWQDAAYRALIAELSGNTDPVAGDAGRFALVALVLVSTVLIPALTATVVDALVKARLAADGPVEAASNHIVVVGLGDVGTQVVGVLREQGIEVIAIERDSQAHGVEVARELDVPVVIGDVTRIQTLAAASVARCRALVITSGDDVANLEAALLGRSLAGGLRVVLRLFDAEFADRVRRAFNINTSRSVSYLAAPAFATAMLGRQVITTIPVRRHVLLVAELPVGADSTLEHQPVSAVNRPQASRLLAIRTGDGAQVLWRPSPGRPVRRTDRLVVVATRTGLSQLLADTASQTDAVPDAFRLLRPWELARPRPPVDPA